MGKRRKADDRTAPEFFAHDEKAVKDLIEWRPKVVKKRDR